MKEVVKYTVQEKLKSAGLSGISDAQINDHWSLYVGYVNQVNRLHDELNQLASDKQQNSLIYADRRRRMGFEYNGMVLHEYYFGNLCPKSSNLQPGALRQAIEKYWGSFECWQEDFANAGKTRGIGWAILYMDTVTGQLINTFVKEHENGNIASFVPLLVMDVWEHAYMVDHKSGGRADYINAFFLNINWNIVSERYEAAVNKKISGRF
jgi:Fe-Mn family superoxide dismutase